MTVPILHVDSTVRPNPAQPRWHVGSSGAWAVPRCAAGGPVSCNLGFEYVRELCSAFFGIQDVRLLQADGLDLPGADVEGLLARAKAMWTP